VSIVLKDINKNQKNFPTLRSRPSPKYNIIAWMHAINNQIGTSKKIFDCRYAVAEYILLASSLRKTGLSILTVSTVYITEVKTN